MGLLKKMKDWLALRGAVVFEVREGQLVNQFNEVAVSIKTDSGKERRLGIGNKDCFTPFMINAGGRLGLLPGDAAARASSTEPIRGSYIGPIALIGTEKTTYEMIKVETGSDNKTRYCARPLGPRG